MSTRISSALAAMLVLAGCGTATDAGNVAAVEAVAEPAVTAERVDCATGDAAFARDCTVERAAVEGGTILTIRHPDGGFRRLTLGDDGSISAADGAAAATVSEAAPGVVEVAVDGARYRLPVPAAPR